MKSFAGWGFGLPGMLLACAAQAAPVTYAIEPVHTHPSFEVPHLKISLWRGQFTRTTGTVVLDREAMTGSVDVTIDPASIEFGNRKLDEHVCSKDFLDTARFPSITYKGTIDRFQGGNPVSVRGTLTMVGVSKPVDLAINSFNCIQHPMFKREACGADAVGTFKRSDFGISYGVSSHGDEITVRIQVEAIREGAP
jgi:polyisoprenoid-binding protein YceI